MSKIIIRKYKILHIPSGEYVDYNERGDWDARLSTRNVHIYNIYFAPLDRTNSKTMDYKVYSAWWGYTLKESNNSCPVWTNKDMIERTLQNIDIFKNKLLYSPDEFMVDEIIEEI